MASQSAADARAVADGWLRLAVALRRPRRIAGLDEHHTLRWVLPLACGIWLAGVGAFAAALSREGLLDGGRLGIYLTLGPVLGLALVVARRTEMLPGFLAFGVITWVAALSLTTPFYYFAGGIIGTAVTAALVTWFGAVRGVAFAVITVLGQAAGGWRYDDPLVLDRVALLALSMAFVILIVGGVADRTEALADERDILLNRFTYLSYHDVLTGLGNRRALEVAFDERDPAGALTLAMFDVDLFKEINDRQGHHCGDLVLQAVADRLRSGYPECFVGRLGGDEFVVLVEAPTSELEVIETAIALFYEPIVLRDGSRRELGVSVGAASWSPERDSLSALLSAADQELYGMKRSRRSYTN